MTIEEVLQHDLKFRYMLLGRLQADCEYYLGFGNKSSRRLWAGSEKTQIEYMTKIHDSFRENEKQYTSELPSKARMCVQILSKNHLSCEITTAQPAKLSKPSSKARSVLISKSFVGSSSKSTFPSSFKVIARCKRLRSPPESMETFLFCSPPPKLNRDKYALEFTCFPPIMINS